MSPQLKSFFHRHIYSLCSKPRGLQLPSNLLDQLLPLNGYTFVFSEGGNQGIFFETKYSRCPNKSSIKLLHVPVHSP